VGRESLLGEYQKFSKLGGLEMLQNLYRMFRSIFSGDNLTKRAKRPSENCEIFLEILE
jgi:hypothetical protein